MRAGRGPGTAGGLPVCVTVTHVDGLVLARSVFEHGVNHRSAMIHGDARKVTDPGEKLKGLRRLHRARHPRTVVLRPPPEPQGTRRHHRPRPLPRRGVRQDPHRRPRRRPRRRARPVGRRPAAERGRGLGRPPYPTPALPPGTAVPDHIARRAGTRHG
ncbi:pyridoxamine 5'-phosphate oxidase family protein [Streptomyces eurythermus]|uniref:pyridoxamine 5'-phosphate oxidase family protein n=1 Tax=Streptomyces eurythermus TaxID=42237 RepID=UPI003F4CB82E